MKRAATTTRPPHEASGHQTLSAYIQARFDEFSRSQKDVAQYIVDHLDEVAFQTAEELARRANTSSSTVVRFSQALGFEGFPELQSSAREEYRRRVASGAETAVPGGSQRDAALGPGAYADLLYRLVAGSPNPGAVPSLLPSPPWTGWDHSGSGLWPDRDDHGRDLNNLPGPQWVGRSKVPLLAIKLFMSRMTLRRRSLARSARLVC